MIDMMEKVDPNDRTKDREPEDFELRYFTEMEVAGLMGFPKDFSFPPDLTTRQVACNITPLLHIIIFIFMVRVGCIKDNYFLLKNIFFFLQRELTKTISVYDNYLYDSVVD